MSKINQAIAERSGESVLFLPDPKWNRRKNDRVYSLHLLQAHIANAEGHTTAVELVDVSHDGCAYRIAQAPGGAWPTHPAELVELRLRFGTDSFVALKVRVVNSRPMTEGGQRYWLFGCEVERDHSGYQVYEKLVSFLGAYVEQAAQGA